MIRALLDCLRGTKARHGWIGFACRRCRWIDSLNITAWKAMLCASPIHTSAGPHYHVTGRRADGSVYDRAVAYDFVNDHGWREAVATVAYLEEDGPL